MNEIRYIDLFSGIGGFRLGFQKTGGFRCVWSCDWDKEANYIYYKKFKPEKESHYPGDVRGVNPKNIPDFEVLCAGFPCPSFSVAGKREGLKDQRGEVFFEIPRIAKIKRPKMLLLENVPGLLNHNGGRTYATILNSLEKLGYWLEWQILNSKYFGVPQTRERVFIIGHLRTESTEAIFPIIGNGRTPSKELIKIGNIAKTEHDSLWGRVYKTEGIAMSLNAEGGGLGAKTGLYAIPVLTPDRSEKRQHGRRFKTPGEPSFTLTSQDVHGVAYPEIANTFCDDWLMDTRHHDKPMCYYRIRRLTPTEGERLQGFPDGWTSGLNDNARYRLLGKAVTTNVVKYLGKLILSSITNKDGSK